MKTSFDELIAEMDHGQVNAELSTSLRSLVKVLRERAESSSTARGEIVLKLKFLATSNGRVEIKAESKITQPGPPVAEETRWIDEKGNLAVADPRQASLPLRIPGAGTGVTTKGGGNDPGEEN